MQNISLQAMACCAVLTGLYGCGGQDETSVEPAAVESAAPPVATAPEPVTLTEPPPGDCAGEQGLTYICGPQAAEDLLSLGSTGLILASGMSGNDTPGHMYLINPQTQGFRELIHEGNFTIAHDEPMFPGCPGPLNVNAFSVHGLSVAETSPGVFSVYTTSHGEREAIEVYELNLVDPAEPELTWTGCVVLPGNTFANSVARLEDGGFVTTKMMDPAAGFGSIASGGITGNVYEWHPGGEVTFVEGTELSGANGIAMSDDERYMYVAAFGTREIVKFDRSVTPVTKETVSVDIVPDNIRWGEAGKLLTAGGNYVDPATCSGANCATGWSVVEVDAETLATRRLGGADQNAALQGVSTALQVGDDVWVGSFNSDRVGYFRLP